MGSFYCRDSVLSQVNDVMLILTASLCFCGFSGFCVTFQDNFNQQLLDHLTGFCLIFYLCGLIRVSTVTCCGHKQDGRLSPADKSYLWTSRQDDIFILCHVTVLHVLSFYLQM